MRFAKILLLIVIVVASLYALLLTESRANLISLISRLESGEKKIVSLMLSRGMDGDLEEYHLAQIASAKIKLPNMPVEIKKTQAVFPSDAERFFYIDSQGYISINGLSDKNTPEAYSQKTLLFCDSRLSSFKMMFLLEALINEKISHIYLAGKTNDSHIAYSPLEITAPGVFPTLYPYVICLLDKNKNYYFNEISNELKPITDMETLREIMKQVRKNSPTERPFIKILISLEANYAQLHNVASMLDAAGAKAIIKLRDEDSEYTLSDVKDLIEHSKTQNKTKGE